jgi:hypothetical protein
LKADATENEVASFDIHGSWQGEYSYDQDEEFPGLPPSSGFVLTAQRGWFGAFHGTIQDDPERGMPDPAVVHGRLKGSTLTFTKRYPVFYVYHNGRTIPLAEYMELEHGLSVDHEVPLAPYYYEGEYDFAREAVSGTWHSRSEEIQFLSNGEPQVMWIPESSGRWTMRRSGIGSN